MCVIGGQLGHSQLPRLMTPGCFQVRVVRIPYSGSVLKGGILIEILLEFAGWNERCETQKCNPWLGEFDLYNFSYFSAPKMKSRGRVNKFFETKVMETDA